MAAIMGCLNQDMQDVWMYRMDWIGGRVVCRMVFGFALVAVAALVSACVTVTDPGVPEAERRAAALNKSIMCPVCPGGVY